MSAAIAVARVGIGRYWSSPARLGTMLVVVLAGWMTGGPLNVSAEYYRSASDWPLAGQGLQMAASIAALLGCVWAASAILDDRDGDRLEMVVSSGCSAWAYLCGTLLSLASTLMAPGVILALALPIQRLVQTRSGSAWPYLAALAVIYLPTVVFAVCFGAAVATLTRSRMLAIGMFSALWVAGVAGFALPVWTQAFDVTGGVLNAGFFQSTGEVGQGVDPAVVRMAAEYMRRLAHVARFTLAGLSIGAACCFGTVGAWLSRRWSIDASPLLVDSLASEAPSNAWPPSLLELRVAGIGGLVVVVSIALFANVLAPLSGEPRTTGIYVVEVITPLLFAFAYAAVFAADAVAGVTETVLATRRHLRPYVTRLVVITTALCFSLGVQSIVWHRAVEMSAWRVFVMGLAPALLLGGLAYLVGVMTRNSASATTLVSALWVLAQLPVAIALASRWGVGGLHPFAVTNGMGTLGFVLDKWVVGVAGIALFAMGLALLGRPERLLKG